MNYTANSSLPYTITKETKSGTRLFKGIKRDFFLYLLMLPGILFLILFKLVPMYGLLISFQEYSPYLGVFNSDWVGFEHFHRFFTNKDFFMLLRNTLAISLLKLIIFFPIPILISLMLNEVGSQKFKGVIQTVVYLPHFLSWVIIVGMSYLLFSRAGIVNDILVNVGIGEHDFLTNKKGFWLMLVLQHTWKEVGWGTIMFLAAISGIDVSQYESARIDGANRVQIMWNITLPSIKNVIVVILLLQLGQIMDSGFEHVFLMQNSAVSDVAEVFETYVYRAGIQSGQFSYSTAVGLFKSIVGFVLVLTSNYFSKKLGEDGIY